MIAIKIELQIPEGKIPEGSNPAGLKERLTQDFDALKTRFTGTKIRGPISEPPREGRAGIAEFLAWLVELTVNNKEFIDVALPLILKAIDAAISYFGPSRVKVTIGSHEIELPKKSSSIEEFIKKVKRELLEKSSRQ